MEVKKTFFSEFDFSVTLTSCGLQDLLGLQEHQDQKEMTAKGASESRDQKEHKDRQAQPEKWATMDLQGAKGNLGHQDYQELLVKEVNVVLMENLVLLVLPEFQAVMHITVHALSDLRKSLKRLMAEHFTNYSFYKKDLAMNSSQPF